MTEITPERSALLLADASRILRRKLAAWPETLQPGELAALLAGASMGEQFKEWRYRITRAIDDGHLTACTEAKETVKQGRIIDTGERTAFAGIAARVVVQEPVKPVTQTLRHIVPAAAAAWLRAADLEPSEPVRAWLGPAWIANRYFDAPITEPSPQASMLLMKCGRLAGFDGREGWPEAFTLEEIAILQYPDDEAARGDLVALLTPAVHRGDIPAVTLMRQPKAWAYGLGEKITEFPEPGLVREAAIIALQQFAKVEPSEYVRAWLGPAWQGEGRGAEKLRALKSPPEPPILQKRIAAIIATARRLEYDPANVVWGGKAAIKKECVKDAKLFTPATFDKAWQAARDAGLIDVEDSETYRKR